MRLALTLLAAATLVFAAATEHHKFTLAQPYSASGTVLQPGSYRAVINGDHATLKQGSKDLLKNIEVETNNSKYRVTEVRSTPGKMSANQRVLKEIDFGGTHTKLIFN